MLRRQRGGEPVRRLWPDTDLFPAIGAAGPAAGPIGPTRPAGSGRYGTPTGLTRPAGLDGFAGLAGIAGPAESEVMDRSRLVRRFLKAVAAQHGLTTIHSEATARFAGLIARALGLPSDDIVRIESAALLHDVGKVAVPREILLKPGPLTEEEWKVIRRHPVESARMVSAVPQFKDLVQAILHHHEAWDGSGYPDGLRGTEIPLAARILAVADAWDAMTSDRPYRPALDPREAARRLLEARGRQFDPDVVDAFLAAMGYDRPARTAGADLVTTGRTAGDRAADPAALGAAAGVWLPAAIARPVPGGAGLPRPASPPPGPAAPTAGPGQAGRNGRTPPPAGKSGGAGQSAG
ncbi:MAG: HD-GYP domain-containing protein [Bacillota bacterium]|nr:MAG: HD-GYP domain-containing protein [Bacillota bacterium]